MSHFAEIDENNKVVRVIVADQEFINSGAVGDPKKWIQTSYNTNKGVHVGGGVPLRKNYAGVGYTYDKERDAFIPPQPYRSWKLDEQTGRWEAPVARPNDKDVFEWDEEKVEWKFIASR